MKFKFLSRWFRQSFTYLKSRIANIPLPIGLSYPYGKLYGWTIHEARHNPEQETLAFFSKHLKPDDCIADIGANIGYYTLQFSQLVGDKGKVVAFEPSPRAFSYLKKAVRRKLNVSLVRKGVYSKNETLTLYSRRPGDGMASVMYQAGDITTQIEVMPLSDHPLNFNWAKIDVEGAEIEVLRGMRMPIRCVLEVARGIIQDRGTTIPEFLQVIEKMGYKVYFIVDGGAIVLWDGNNLDQLKHNIYIEPNNQ